MTTFTIQVPPAVVAPRGAALAAWLFRRASQALAWCLQAQGARAAIADQAARICEANRVRRLAHSVRHTDPRFAADLYGAADQHELGR